MKKLRGRPDLVRKTRKFAEASVGSKITLRQKQLSLSGFNYLCEKYGVPNALQKRVFDYLRLMHKIPRKVGSVNVKSANLYCFVVGELCKTRDSGITGPAYKNIADKASAKFEKGDFRETITSMTIKRINEKFNIIPKERISVIAPRKQVKPTYKLPLEAVNLIAGNQKVDFNAFKQFSLLSPELTKKIFDYYSDKKTSPVHRNSINQNPLFRLLLANTILKEKEMTLQDIAKAFPEMLKRTSTGRLSITLSPITVQTYNRNFLEIRGTGERSYKHGGRRTKPGPATEKAISVDLTQGLPVSAIAKKYGISISPVYRIFRGNGKKPGKKQD